MLNCDDCGAETAKPGGDYYVAEDDIWEKAVRDDGALFLCLNCLEARLGFALTAGHFRALPQEVEARLFGDEDLNWSAVERERELQSWRLRSFRP